LVFLYSPKEWIWTANTDHKIKKWSDRILPIAPFLRILSFFSFTSHIIFIISK
jgi:lipid A disaccharide synthetase